MGDKKWKSNLLASSLPLEFDAAKLLVSKGFFVRSDYTYARNDSGVVKDFSVDIEATEYPPFRDPNAVSAFLNLLIECKYRHRNVKWLFYPDPNDPVFSPTLGRTIRVIDEFSAYVIPSDATVDFDANLPICYKGTEVNFGNQKVYDAELKHGIAQLQYALPRLFTEAVSFLLSPHIEENIPFIFCPILLTTAELLVTNEKASIQEVETISNIDELTTKVPYLLIYSNYGPDFKSHCSKECSSLEALDEYEAIKMLEDKRQKSKHKTALFNYPSAIGKSLAKAERFHLIQYFTQFVVCTYSEFPKLIDHISKIVTEVIKIQKPL